MKLATILSFCLCAGVAVGQQHSLHKCVLAAVSGNAMSGVPDREFIDYKCEDGLYTLEVLPLVAKPPAEPEAVGSVPAKVIGHHQGSCCGSSGDMCVGMACTIDDYGCDDKKAFLLISESGEHRCISFK